MTKKNSKIKKNDIFKPSKFLVKSFALLALPAIIIGRLALEPFAWLSKFLIKNHVPNGVITAPGIDNNVHNLMYSFNTFIEFEMFKRGFDQYLIKSALMVTNMTIFILSTFMLAKGILSNDENLRSICFLIGTFSFSTVTTLIIDNLLMVEYDFVTILNS